jgi:hypothetical protein
VEVDMKRAVPVESATALIHERIKKLGEWRGKTLAIVHEIIHDADPEIVEEWKWVKATNPGTPVWSHGAMVCTGRDVQERRQDDICELGVEHPRRKKSRWMMSTRTRASVRVW